MDNQNGISMPHLEWETIEQLKKKKEADWYMLIHELRKHDAKWKKPDAKCHIPYDSIS